MGTQVEVAASTLYIPCVQCSLGKLNLAYRLNNPDSRTVAAFLPSGMWDIGWVRNLDAQRREPMQSSVSESVQRRTRLRARYIRVRAECTSDIV